MVDQDSGAAARVVIVGAGFAGLEAARFLGRAGIDTLVIDRKNHHLFQPLLYQVATAALSAADIAEPVRKVLRGHGSVRVLYGEVTQIDPQERCLQLADGARIAYRRLLLAAGSQPGYFGHDDWRALAPGLKSVNDALAIRSRLLLSFEAAERAASAEERRRLTTFIVIGGGPTGVEIAGSIAELSRHTLARDFRRISPAATRIILAEGGPRLLAGFDEKLARYAHRRLLRLGVEIRTGCMADEVGAGAVRLAGESIPCGLAIWAAGVASSPLGKALGVPLDKTGRVIVNPDMSVPGHPEIFVLGDLARLDDESGTPLPGLAQVAKQQGRHLGKGLARHLSKGEAMAPFRYRSRGNTAIVGRHAAVYQYRSFRLTGWLAWLGWAIVHVYLLAGFQHRLMVSLQWLWRYLTYERGARLVSGSEPEERPPGQR